MIPDWLESVHREHMKLASGWVPFLPDTPGLDPSLVWARYEPPHEPPGPWIGTNERWACERGLTVGTPAPGDLIVPPDSNLIARLWTPPT